MSNKVITGMKSAHEHAKECAYGSNMSISTALVVEMTDRIAELEKERDAEYENAHDFNREHEELKHRLEVAQSNVEMLEKERDELLKSQVTSPAYIEAHNLEQQAKALREFKFKPCHTQTILDSLSDGSYSQEDHDLVFEELKAAEIILGNESCRLISQAKVLKEDV